MKNPSQRGVALVVTLLMLSVVTVTAVAFLALSRRERAGVTQSINLSDARGMADTALERAKGQIIAPIVATGNMLAGDLMGSRNYINTNGYDPKPSPVPNPYNVSYVYANGQPLNPNDFIQCVGNLQFDPRVPVFVRTNRPGARPASEFRFYVDLNRNGQFDTNGFFLPYDDFYKPLGTNIYYFVGDPEWIGVLEKPNLPHSANNRFIGRYAFIAQPVGKSLDLNFIHNQSQADPLFSKPNPGRFFRDQGFGTYEINLAAFLTALNTNSVWADPNPSRPGYFYATNCYGTAFDDALELIQYRYQGDYNANDTVQTVFFPYAGAALAFTSDAIDGLARAVDAPVPPEDMLLHAWPGASSRQHFYTIHDLYTRGKSPPYNDFADHLTQISAGTNSYDRYTPYRLWSQLGTDTAEEPQQAEIPRLIQQISAQTPGDFLADTVGRINVNYDNARYVAAQFHDWEPLNFFATVGHVLLKSQSNFFFTAYGINNVGITNIPISPTSLYLPFVHRLLQVAANIYDATTNNWVPSVFLPQVASVNNSAGGVNSYISGYTTNLNRTTAMQWASDNNYSLPAVVGVKKGLPNFNEFVFQTYFQITRKLEVGRPDTNSLPNQTNQMILLSVSNLVAVENWNSYSGAFSNEFEVYVTNIMTCVLSNMVDGSFYPVTSYAGSNFVVQPATNQSWHFDPRFPDRTYNKGGFMVPLLAGMNVLTNSRYFEKAFDDLRNSYLPRTGELPISDWRLVVSNRLTYIVSSPRGPNGKVLDLVCLPYQTNLNLTDFLQRQSDIPAEPYEIGAMWNTNRISSPATVSTPTDGIIQQLQVSLGNPRLSDADWKAYNAGTDKTNSITSFREFVLTASPSSNRFQQAPFTASRKFVHTVTLQANDPLVHYMVEDMMGTTNELRFTKPNDAFTNNLNIGRLNDRYQPWLGNPKKSLQDTPDPIDTYVGIKDPGVFGSDDWDFPSQKFPNIGWLGRVHRGTPWQTIYLKAEVANPRFWARMAQHPLSHPTNDWRLLDIFTVAQTPNSSHGQLSINQSGLAAWTAVLGDITVISNTMQALATPPRSSPTSFTNLLVDPVRNVGAIQRIVDAINRTRLQTPNQVFRSLGEILRVPELTTASPFINQNADPATGFSAQDIQEFSLNDEAYERIPRQILSLLKVGDARYVVYAFGQSLKPADKSIVTSTADPRFFGMCTNYQITGEVFTRTLVKLEGTNSVVPFGSILKTNLNVTPVVLNFNILPAD